MRFINYLLQFLKIKYVFKKPKKSNFLIFDIQSLSYLNFCLKKNYEIYHVRGEQINVYNLIYTFFFSGFFNFRENYKLNYFKFVDPKFVITAIDENIHFYLLKDKYTKPIYISFQRGLRSHYFISSIKKMRKKNPKILLKSDFIFVLGRNDKSYMSKYIKGKYYISGNLLNNVFHLEKIKDYQKLDEIVFISSRKYFSFQDYTNHIDFKLFSYLLDYCKRREIKLTFLSKSGQDKKRHIQKLFKYKKFNYISFREKSKFVSDFNSYKILSKSKLMIFSVSSIGHEFVSKGVKGISFNPNFPNKNFCKKYAKYGIYWSKKIDFKNFDKIINKVFSMKQSEWDKKTRKVSSEILKYDHNNQNNILIFKKVFKSYINSFFKIKLITTKQNYK